MAFPSLGELNPRELLKKHAPDGIYCLENVEDFSKLNEDCKSMVGILRGKFDASDEDTLALRDFIRDDEKVPKTKFMGNFVHRKQTTFGAKYNFGQQTSHHPINEDTPKAVKAALQFAKYFIEENNAVNRKDHPEKEQLDASKYNGVHVNYYPFGKAGVQPHYDAEESLDLSLPIISITLLAGSRIPRDFSIYDKPGPKKTDKPLKIADIELRHGDVVIMAGEMQDHFLHGIEKSSRRDLEHAERLNLTIRAFKPDSAKRQRVDPR